MDPIKRWTAIAAGILVLGLLFGCRTTATKTEAGTAGPMNERDRMRAEQWARATEGLEFGDAGGLVEVRPVSAGDLQAAQVHLATADELLGLNRVMEAMEQYTLAARNNPQRADAYLGLGTTLQQKGKLDEAIAAFRTAIDREPRHLDAQYRLAIALWAATEQDQALEAMRRVVTLDDEHAAAHGRLAVWSYYVEDYATAWRHLHRAQALGGELPAQLPSLLQTKLPDPGNEPPED